MSRFYWIADHQVYLQELFEINDKKQGKVIIVKGIGGSQIAGEPVEGTIRFKCGWSYAHPLKPMKFHGTNNQVILGRDFMQIFDETLFDWINGRIKIGSDWVWFAAD